MAPLLLAWNPLVQDGQSVAWAALNDPLPLADGPSVWRKAAAEWSQTVAVGFVPVHTQALGPDGIVGFSVAKDSLTWNTWVGDPAVIAFTLITREDGVLIDADVILNAAEFVFSDHSDARLWHRPTVILHELGHVLGLGHSTETGAMMAARLEPGEVRTLTVDDQTGVAAVLHWLGNLRRPSVAKITPSDSSWQLHLTAVEAEDHYRLWTNTRPGLRASVTESTLLTIDTKLIDADCELELWSLSGQGFFETLTFPQHSAFPVLVDEGCSFTVLSTQPRWTLFFMTLALYRRRWRGRVC